MKPTSHCSKSTLESGIDIGQGINVGPGKLDKNDKHRALNKRRAWKTFQNFDKRRAFNKAVGPGKKSKVNKRRACLFQTLEYWKS